MGIFAHPSPVPSKSDDLLQWLSLDPPLPVQLALVPSICRFIAFLLFLPVIALALTDVFGWAIFKLVLRPLGYASTTRFKDPEPEDVTKMTTTRRSRSTSKPRSSSRPRISPTDSDYIDATIDGDSERSGHSKPSNESTAEGDTSSSSDAQDESRSPSRSPQLPHHLTLGDRADSYSSSGTSRLNRFRAPSVGFDGPLFAVGEELASPGRSDDEPLPEMEDGPVTQIGMSDGSDNEGSGTGGARRRVGPRRGTSSLSFTSLGTEDK
ncbi:BZ3500_MvSof-1268-A1-R1_Chr9g10770 [Microbotryum saponariae]|uniref:BZ3500_MvSof-1268-A1-R1_Chr9g10770 protein n=1 Tax=Microbotryum saponariae TaxID=289078 RepID=A0A2X0MFU7_9BASI|nr:BZ3501_MvSof-1269-A2-R1_Chr9g10518 [Microbotryum saponariae]SDA00659.1 BZ3500_MvSof-1268-A1-R1_Chr9g10770 [Microbotryum saponariae]